MRFAIMESVVTPGGHEIDFDRILVEELTALGHTVEFYVPEGHEFKWNYGVPVHHIPGSGVSYQGARGIRKMILSIRRETHRQKWYKTMMEYARKGVFDALIFPSATYRYLRALKINSLRHSPVPVLFLIHGATPKEAEKLDHEAIALASHKMIRIGVQTFAAEKLSLLADNIRIYAPPNYIPRDIRPQEYMNRSDTLILGFFGQYRREKKIRPFLDAFAAGNYRRKVKLIVQGATQTPEDAEDFARIIEEYSHNPMIEFWHRPLIGVEWQKGISGVDAIVIPYGNDRYLYHTSALISNAMGYRKPIIAVDNVNPEILSEYRIGLAFKNGDIEDLQRTIEAFVNTYDEKQSLYAEELERAYQAFTPQKMVENIVAMAQGRMSEEDEVKE